MDIVENPHIPAPRSRPSLQPVRAKAQATHDAFLVTTRQLLATRDFDLLSIAEIAAANGLSVGSFYGRFRDKEAFFAVLQEKVTGEWVEAIAQVLAPPARGTDTAPKVVARICHFVVKFSHSDAGFLRAAVKHASTQPSGWTPMKRTGRHLTLLVLDALGPLLGGTPARGRDIRIGFAMQMLFGTCINAVLHDPGPLLLGSRQLERELTRAMCLYLGIKGDASSTTHQQQ